MQHIAFAYIPTHKSPTFADFKKTKYWNIDSGFRSDFVIVFYCTYFILYLFVGTN